MSGGAHSGARGGNHSSHVALRSAATFDGEPLRVQDDLLQPVSVERIVMQGRGQMRCPTMTKHLFSSTFSNAEGTPVLIEPQQTIGFLKTKYEDPRVYTLKLAGYDLLRVSLEPLDALRQDQLQSLPAGVTRSEPSQIKAWINPYDYSDPRPILIDWNQEIEILCANLSVGIFGPPNIIPVPADNARAEFDALATNARSGMVVDAVLSGTVWATEAPRGKTWARLTTTHVIAAAAQPVIEVPNRAVAMVGFQSNIGAATASWLMLYGSGTSAVVGSIPWVARKTADTEIPLTNVSHLLPDVDPVNARVFNLRWKIQL